MRTTANGSSAAPQQARAATRAGGGGFSVLVLKEPLSLNHAFGFGFVALGAWFIFRGPFA